MTGVLLVAHDRLGAQCVAIITAMLGTLSRPTESLPVAVDADPRERAQAGREAVTRLDNGHGVLIITDIAGATPSNIAAEIAGSGHTRLITGLNLGMLIRIYNYPDLTLEALTASALEAGRHAVVDWPPRNF